MVTLKTLMGGAGYYAFSTDLQMGTDWPKVIRAVPSGGGLKMILANPILPMTCPQRFLILNEGGSSLTISKLTFPLGVPTPVTVIVIPAGQGAIVSYLVHNGGLDWGAVLRTPGIRSSSYQTLSGGTPTPPYSPITIPAPHVAPPPPVGSPGDLSSASSTYTVTITGATGDCAIWNGVWTVTKTTSESTTYWRGIVDPNHWIDIRNYPNNAADYGGGGDYNWHIVLVDLTLKCRRRLGASDPSAIHAPPVGLYVCFNMLSEQSNCSPAVVATLS